MRAEILLQEAKKGGKHRKAEEDETFASFRNLVVWARGKTE